MNYQKIIINKKQNILIMNPLNSIILNQKMGNQCNPMNQMIGGQYNPMNQMIGGQYNPMNQIMGGQYNPMN